MICECAFQTSSKRFNLEVSKRSINNAMFPIARHHLLQTNIGSIGTAVRGHRQMHFVRRSRTCTAMAGGGRLKSVINV